MQTVPIPAALIEPPRFGTNAGATDRGFSGFVDAIGHRPEPTASRSETARRDRTPHAARTDHVDESARADTRRDAAPETDAVEEAPSTDHEPETRSADAGSAQDGGNGGDAGETDTVSNTGAGQAPAGGSDSTAAEKPATGGNAAPATDAEPGTIAEATATPNEPIHSDASDASDKATPATPAQPGHSDASDRVTPAQPGHSDASDRVIAATPATPASPAQTGHGEPAQPATPAVPASASASASASTATGNPGRGRGAQNAQTAATGDGAPAQTAFGDADGDRFAAGRGGDDAADSGGFRRPGGNGAAANTGTSQVAAAGDIPEEAFRQASSTAKPAAPAVEAALTRPGLQAPAEPPLPPVVTPASATATLGNDIRLSGDVVLTTATVDDRAAAGPVVKQVAVQISRAVQDGNNRISIRLNPAELGRVSIKLEVGHDNRVIAVISAERPETLDLLQRDARTLERALQEAGLRTDSGSLSFDLQGHENDSRFADDTGSAEKAFAMHGPGRNGTEAAPPVHMDRIGPAGVDIRV